MTFHSPSGGHPGQRELLTSRAIVTNAYTVIPGGVLRDIVTSVLPEFTDSRAWILARPIDGFSTTFAQLVVEVEPGGGSTHPEPEPEVQGVLFVTRGQLQLTLDGTLHALTPGSYVYVAPGAAWSIHNESSSVAAFQWIRKHHERLGPLPESFVTHDDDVTPTPMPDTNGAWATSRFVAGTDLRHDMHVNIVTFQPGGSIPFAETHVMEHGLYVLQGKAVYRLNDDWVEVEAGDYIWMRAFCPQACYAGGPEPFRYLLYKDVNRQMRLTPAERNVPMR